MPSYAELLTTIRVKEIRGDTTVQIKDIQYDSRRAGREDLFVAIRGFQSDGHRYVAAAREGGCRAFLVEEMVDFAEGEGAMVRVENTRSAMPVLCRNLHGGLLEHLNLVGITGTNGKTTTAYLIYSIMKAAGWQPGLISTVENIAGGLHEPAQRTTPETPDLYRLFAGVVAAGGTGVVMEVSSHALSLHRVDDIPFRVGVFTNLGHDHLDFHGTPEEYIRAKKKLFDRLPQESVAVINGDDAQAERMVRDCPATVRRFSLTDERADIRLLASRHEAGRQYLSMRAGGRDLDIETTLPGEYNAANILAAAGAAQALGISDSAIEEGLRSLSGVPGRMETFYSPRGFRAVVDYAHTPDALARVLEALRQTGPRRLIVVFGCGGDRDREKRPRMGGIAEEYGDEIILTSDNPRSEAPGTILQQIREGISADRRAQIEPDREAAILKALELAGPGDVVLVAGKGHETYQEIGGARLPFDDRDVIRRHLAGSASGSG